MPQDLILLFSGGVDSYCAWWYLDKPSVLFVDIGSKYIEKEKFAVKMIAEKVGMDLLIDDSAKNYGRNWERKDFYIPWRNIILCTIAANYGNKIGLIGICGDKVEDKGKQANKILSECLTKLGKEKKIEIFSPFLFWTKRRIISWYLKSKYPKDVLLSTVSCYNGNFGHCGNCPACLRRFFGLYGFFSEDELRNNFAMWPAESFLFDEYVKRAKIGYYDKERCNDILSVKKIIA